MHMIYRGIIFNVQPRPSLKGFKKALKAVADRLLFTKSTEVTTCCSVLLSISHPSPLPGRTALLGRPASGETQCSAHPAGPLPTSSCCCVTVRGQGVSGQEFTNSCDNRVQQHRQVSNHDLKIPSYPPQNPQILTRTLSVPPPSPGRAGTAFLGAPPPSRRTAPPRPRAPPTCPSSRQRALAAPSPVTSRLPAAGRHGELAGSAMQRQGAAGAGRATERRRGSAAELPAGARTGRAPGRRRGGPSLFRAAACARCLCLPRAALRDRERRGASAALRPAPQARCGGEDTPQHGFPAASAP